MQPNATGFDSAAASAALSRVAERWSGAKARERANYQLYIGDLCEALGVERPRPAGSGYEFEFPVRVIERSGVESSNFVDLFKRDHFVLEAKDGEAGRPDDVLLRKAYGQARSYVTHLPGKTPPYVLVLDVGKTMTVWDRWAGGFGGFAAGKRIDLPSLGTRPADIELLRDIWRQPDARDPRAKSQAVTEAIAAKLARLAAALEGRGHGQEAVSRFLMRCVFTMFAEDVRLLHDEPFRRLIDEVALPNPDEFVAAAEDLWRAMDRGERFGFRKLLRFNGHFFKDATALALTKEDLRTLSEAAQADWSDVQPAIFGTLLTRALDPAERHRLGAEYTPPEFIERVVRPAVEEPLRERWTAVQTEVLQLREAAAGKGRKAAEQRKVAEQRLREFHDWLRSLRFLDPACGSGNFLYVTMQMVKRIEVEVLNELAEITGSRELRFQEVDPSQFHGIEVKPWAREIAELTLWIGFHQFWRNTHGDVQPDEPILRDTGTLENRDAVLASDGERRDRKRDRQDPTPRIKHPVTGELVPDPKAMLEYREVIHPREAEWPRADFIIGNPPFMGKLKQRDALGDGYVDALRAAYPELPDAADLVMYWWNKAAKEVAEGRTIRAGLITTKSITHATNRAIVAKAAEGGARVVWAIGDHYWNDGGDDARVRVAMTVIAGDVKGVTLVEVDGDAKVIAVHHGPRLNFDLSILADVAGAGQPLLAAKGVSSLGFMLGGAGFQLDRDEAARVLAADARHSSVVRPLMSGRDLTERPRPIWVIDLGVRTEAEARDCPMLYDIVRDRVRPERAANKRASYANYWWRFAEPRKEWRAASAGLRRYLVTPETSKHRIFTIVDAAVAASHSLVCVGLDDGFALGVLSSAIHAAWALAAGSRLGIDGTPRYNKSTCFEAFPFPDPPAEARRKIADVAERIDAHRKAALARGDKVGMTVMYNVVEKLRLHAYLTGPERAVHELAACGTLRDLHDELDRLVAEAYGWPAGEAAAARLDRLVALHDERIAEERGGKVRWLRPEYQVPRFARDGVAVAATEEEAAPEAASTPARSPWPADAIGQITALRALAVTAPITVDGAVLRFEGARRELVARHLETLAILGELRTGQAGAYFAPV